MATTIIYTIIGQVNYGVADDVLSPFSSLSSKLYFHMMQAMVELSRIIV